MTTLETELKEKDKLLEQVIFKHLVLEMTLAVACFFLGFMLGYLV